ncbi:MAG TPA: tetratricopeptide repeat protein [Myxococcota bacterium]|nr:tetratricopeptide repeat protein [Myxococcota bacterium]
MSPWLLPRQEADRQSILEQAARERSRGRRRRAIALYRTVLATERSNAELHAKLAPLLAETGQSFDAWQSYRVVAHAALREGREDRALGAYREATQLLPREIEAWQGVARILCKRAEEPEAVEVLVEGSRQFRTPFLRPLAIHLLRRARSIEPWNPVVVLELAEHLGRADQPEEARLLLAELALRTSGKTLRRVRLAELRVDPSVSRALRWLRAWRTPEIRGTVEDRPPSEVVPLRAVRRSS